MNTLRLPVNSRSGPKGFALVRDDEFGRALARRSWCLNSGYVVTATPTGTGLLFLHKMVFAHYHGKVPPGRQIDHKNRNKRDNRPENLRAETPSVQGANKGLIRTNKSGFSGVSWDAQRQRWNAIVQKDGKSIRLGRFKSKQEANAAVVRAYRLLYPNVRHQGEV